MPLGAYLCFRIDIVAMAQSPICAARALVLLVALTTA
jgi:hypothetical protein